MLQMETVFSSVYASQSAQNVPVVSDHPRSVSKVNEFSSSLYVRRGNIILSPI